MSQVRARFAGSGIAVPPRVVDNTTLSRVMETNDDWIRERSGVVERRYVESGVASSDLGAEAARAALADAGMAADEVDYIVCATMTPDHFFPGCGTLLQQKLGIRPIPALDIRQQCAGFAYGLQMVDALIRSGIARNVLLVGTDVHTSLMPFSDRTWAVLDGRDRGAARRRGSRLELAFPASARALRGRRRRDGLPGVGGGRRTRNSRRAALRRRQPPGHPDGARSGLFPPAVRHRGADRRRRRPSR